MKKEELRKLKTLRATPAMIEKAKNNTYTGEKKDFYYDYKRNYGVFLRGQHLKGIIKIAIYLPDDLAKGRTEPKAEVFLNVEGEEYISRILEGGKERWSKAMICNIIYQIAEPSYLYYSKNKAYMNKDLQRTIKRELKQGVNNEFTAIEIWQKKIKNAETEKKEERQQAPWKKDMSLIPQAPDGFEKWLQKKGIDQHYIFYRTENKKKGFCSYCEDEVDICSPKHNAIAKCRKCRNTIQYKNVRVQRRLIGECKYVSLLQNIKGGYCVRTFRAYKKYLYDTRTGEIDYQDPRFVVREVERVLYLDAEVKIYEWGIYKNKYMTWQPEYCFIGGKSNIYTRNIGNIHRKDSEEIRKLAQNTSVNINTYFYQEKRNPVIEKCLKLDMYQMLEDIVSNKSESRKGIDSTKTELSKALKIDKARLKRLRKMNGGYIELMWLQFEKQQNTIYPDEIITFFAHENIGGPRMLYFIADKMSYVKIYNYIKKQMKMNGETAIQNLITWRDYLNMAEKAKMQVDTEKIYRPANIKEAHNELIKLRKGEDAKKEAAKWRKKYKKVDEVCRTLTKYEYEDNEYAIVAPKSVEDIVMEGMILRHCIHTCDYYFDRINRRESYLLFLRRKKEKETPWYTLEVEPGGTIRQKRTVGDNQNKDLDAAIPFLKKWQQEIQKRLTQEDKENATKAESLRKQNYAELRTKGNRVWHGRLSGKLLADVLEEDLMEIAELEKNMKEVM